MNPAVRINDVYPRHIHINSQIGSSISHSISKTAKEGRLLEEHISYLLQGTDFELLRSTIDDFPLEGREQTVRTGQDRSKGESEIILLKIVDELLGLIGLTNSSGSQIHHLITHFLDILIQ